MTWHEHTEYLFVHRDVAQLPCSPCLQPQEQSSQLCLGKRETRPAGASPSRQHISFVKIWGTGLLQQYSGLFVLEKQAARTPAGAGPAPSHRVHRTI